MIKATITKKHFKAFKRIPLFFIKKVYKQHTESRYDKSSGTYEFVLITEEEEFWCSMREEISIAVDEDDIKETETYTILIADDIIRDDDKIELSCHTASPQNKQDWIVIINSFNIRSSNKEDIYPFTFLLWFLEHHNWSVTQLINAVTCYPDTMTLCMEISKIGRCLSYNNQQKLQDAFTRLGYDHYIYWPEIINEALNCITPSIPEQEKKNKNIFDLIDYFFEHYGQDTDEHPILQTTEAGPSNCLIKIYNWLKTDTPLDNYNLLVSVYSMISQDLQLKLIKRYFHDIRLRNTKLDINILQQFKNNKYGTFIRYRHCINNPEETIPVGNQLLCDSSITLLKTKGTSFQELNGILDFIITQCDKYSPNVDLGLDMFLPRCNGGAIYNNIFKGFIDYEITYLFDENRLTKENIEKTIRNILDIHGEKEKYYVCKYDKKQKPLSTSDDSYCLKFIEKIRCIERRSNENKWVVRRSEYQWLNLFLDEKLSVNDQDDSYIYIAWKDTFIGNMKKSILNLVAQQEKAEDETFIIKSQNKNDIETKLLIQFSTPKTIRIYPQTKPFMGYTFDIFNINSQIDQSKPEDYRKKEFEEKEANEITNRVIASLKAYLQKEDYNGKYFEIPYDNKKLDELLNLYYFKGSIDEKTKNDELQFLRRKTPKERNIFCSPKLSPVHNPAVNIPYYWCMGKECFKNTLEDQTLQNSTSWDNYTIFHLCEIIDFPQIHNSTNGCEPSENITKFIVVANKALKKFKRLKCRTCGHLIYAIKEDSFNRSNYYACINSNCTEYNKSIYLNYCYKCKKGLIDSRDSKQCPNGWYICPTCLACCNDQQYDRLTQRYVLSHRPIPERIKEKIGYGHNDKGLYFCPNCGLQLEVFFDNKGKLVNAICPNCNNRKFDIK